MSPPIQAAAASVLVLEASGMRFRVETTPAIIGRQPGVSVELHPVQVSRRHAELVCDPFGQWTVSDQRSAAGSGLNGHRLLPLVAQPLAVGDTLLIADLRLKVLAIEQRLPPPAPASPQDVAFQTAAGQEAGAALGVMHTYRVRPVNALGGEDAAQALELVLNLSRELARATELETVLAAVAHAITQLLGTAERLALQYQREGQTLHAWRERSGIQLDRPKWLSQTVVDWVQAHGEVLISNSPLNDKRFDSSASLHMGRARGLVVAPISDGQKILGVLYVDTQASIVYPPASQKLADIIATIAVASQGAVERLLQTQAHRNELAMRQNLQRFLAPQVVARLRSEGQHGQRLATRRVNASVLFADIAGFTDLSARLSPEEISQVLSVVFNALVPVVFAHEGTLDKFIGDCVMAVFGAPDEMPDHAERAVRAGLQMIEAFNRSIGTLHLPNPIRLRVAVHSGALVAGEMGSEQRREYTVIGTTVNIAARIEGIGEAGALTISDATRMQLPAGFIASETGIFPLKGIPEPMRLFRMALG